MPKPLKAACLWCGAIHTVPARPDHPAYCSDLCLEAATAFSEGRPIPPGAHRFINDVNADDPDHFDGCTS